MRFAATNPIHTGMVDVYIKDQGVKVCPVQPKPAQTIFAGNEWDPYWGSFGGYPTEFGPFGKTADYNVNGVDKFGKPIKGASESDIEQESNTIVMWEHWSRVPWCQFTQNEAWLETPPQNDADRSHFSWLHYDGANTMWADGHAKRMLYDQLRRWMFGCRKRIYPNYQ